MEKYFSSSIPDENQGIIDENVEYNAVEIEEIYEDSFESDDSFENSEDKDNVSNFEDQDTPVNTSTQPIQDKVNVYQFTKVQKQAVRRINGKIL